MENILDVFGGNEFGVVSLTNAINKVPFKPSRVGEMGLFEAKGVNTHTIVIEEKDGILSLLPTKTRGLMEHTAAKNEKRRLRTFNIPYIPYDDTILAASIQGVRAFGSASQTETMAQVVNDKLAQMRQSHELTHEFHRIGAIQGDILDADGSTSIYNLFTEYGITRRSVAFAFTTATTDVRALVLTVKRAIEKALGAVMYDHIHCFCGKNWFDALIGHDYVKDAYHRYQDSTNLRNDPRAGFEFGGVIFEEYRGSIGAVDFVDDDEANFFPVGVPGLFQAYYGPADFVETVNTIGVPVYAKQERLAMDKGIYLHTQSNPLMLCTRPETLVLGTAT